MLTTFAEPDWALSIIDEKEDLSSFHTDGISIVSAMTGMIVQQLRYHFSSENNIVNPLLESMIWTDSEETTNIKITTASEYNPSLTGKTPALYVKRDACQGIPLGLSLSDVYVSYPKDGVSECSCSRGYCKGIEGAHSILCEAFTGAASEALAVEVWDRLMFFGPVIASDFKLKKFDVPAIGEVSQTQTSGGDTYITPITIKWSKVFSWGIHSNIQNYNTGS